MSFFRNNNQKNLNKLNYVVVLSMKHNSHKPNYNAGAVILVSRIKPKVNNGRITNNKKIRFRQIYNKYAVTVNQSAKSMFAQKIANDPYLMKRYFNRRNAQAVPTPNRSRVVPTPNRSRVVPTPNRSRVVPTPNRSSCKFKKLSFWGNPVYSC